MRWVAFALFIFVLGSAPHANAQRRVALVIGNGAYTKVPALTNPMRDTAALEALLRTSGFDFVHRVDNLGLAEMRRALRDFSAEVASAGFTRSSRKRSSSTSRSRSRVAIDGD